MSGVEVHTYADGTRVIFTDSTMRVVPAASMSRERRAWLKARLDAWWRENVERRAS